MRGELDDGLLELKEEFFFDNVVKITSFEQLSSLKLASSSRCLIALTYRLNQWNRQEAKA